MVTILFETFRFLKPDHDCNPPTGWNAPGYDNFPSSQRRRISLARPSPQGDGPKKTAKIVGGRNPPLTLAGMYDILKKTWDDN